MIEVKEAHLANIIREFYAITPIDLVELDDDIQWFRHFCRI